MTDAALVVAGWKDRIEAMARRFRETDGVEYDDLVQEGMISVWIAAANGRAPSEQIVRARMIDWCRRMRSQSRGRPTDPYTLTLLADAGVG